ncbi:SH3 domain-containing protein [Aquimarina gracilis]|uniref:SH3 domain-containing protein n=1 Tax=Aquimarina gracilis TaxID=874422 RepID=A0ABU5ZRY9_9FLAO|nr:SH3 domain-containing protein [Aquimarina gracilis]MEB3344834.1 SH3 domain-containing protein [Aquimarina gracilis]
MKSIFTFILLLVITFSSAYAQSEQYLMSAQKLTVRSGPGLNFNTIAEVPQGTQVYVMSSNYGEWSAIQYKSMNGFVITKHLTEDSRIADAERAAKEAAAKREAAKAAAQAAIAQAEAAKRAAEEAARRAIANAERLKREAEANAAKAIADAEAAKRSKDAAARKALADTRETQKALEEARRRAAQGDVAAAPIESTTPSYGSSSNASTPTAATMTVTREDKYSSWESKTYKSGATPKSFNFKGKFDYKLDNYLKIKVGKNTECVVKLYKMGKTENDDELVRITYINKSTTQFIRNIPQGEYYLKIAYGFEWKEKVINGKRVGTFTKNALYEKGTQILDFNTVKTSKGISVPSYNLSLDLRPSGSGGYQTNGEENISPEQFNSDRG